MLLKILLVNLLLCSTMLLAQENLIKNGDFEKVSKVLKSSNAHIFNKIREGWDFGIGPLAKLPASWIPNLGVGKLEVVNRLDNEEDVFSGQHALKVTTEKSCHIYTSGAGNKRYEISLQAKGTAKLSIAGYFYGKDEKSGVVKNIGAATFLSCQPAENEWQQFQVEVDILKQQPGARSFALAIVCSKGWVLIDDVVMLEKDAPSE